MSNGLTASDGHTFECAFTDAIGKRLGGIVILQEIFGVTDQLKGIARQYAALGYDVAIPALFDRQERGAVIPFDQAPLGRALKDKAELANTLMDIEATVSALADRGLAVAVMGFCWGGGLAVRSAQKLDIAGAISFYGTSLDRYLDCSLKSPVLGHFGEHDDHVPQETLAAAQAYLPEMEVHLYDAGHAFANDARDAYVAESAHLAHQRNAEFLERIIASGDR